MAALKALPALALRAGYVFFGAAAAWFLYNIWHLSNADFGDYRVPSSSGSRRSPSWRSSACPTSWRAGRSACSCCSARRPSSMPATWSRTAPQRSSWSLRLRRHRPRHLARGPAVEAARLPRVAFCPARRAPGASAASCGLRHPALPSSLSPIEPTRHPSPAPPSCWSSRAPPARARARCATGSWRGHGLRAGRDDARPARRARARSTASTIISSRRRNSTRGSPRGSSSNGPGCTASAATAPWRRACSSRLQQGRTS